jgi:hypothetical protein
MGERKGPQVLVGIYPSSADIQSFVAEAGASRDENIEQLSQEVCSDGPFLILTVGSKKQSQALTNFSGPKALWASAMDSRSYQTIINDVNSQWPDICQGNELQLSNLKERNFGCDFNFPSNAAFLIFYCAVKCKEQSIEIAKLSFWNPDVTGGHGFWPLPDYFPRLQQLLLANETELIDKLKGVLERANIQIVRSESDGLGGEASSVVWDPYLDRPWERPRVCPPVYPYAGARAQELKLTLDMFPPISLELDAFPTNPFVVQYFEVGWQNLAAIGDFYSDDAVFSATVNSHGRFSALDAFDRFGRVAGEKIENMLIGAGEIAQGLVEMFGGHWYAHPTEYVCLALTGEMCAVSINGVFLSAEENVVAFERSMTVQFLGSGLKITNDHHFLREATLD